MIRLRVSTLEDFRRVLNTEWGDEGRLVERIKRGQWAEGEATEEMRRGTAWHAVLEDPIGLSQIEFDEKGEPFQIHEWEGFWFDASAVHAALKHQGPGMREVWGKKLFQVGRRTVQVGRRTVQVEGTCDHIRGLVIRDAKTSTSPDARSYEPSLQWRFYLHLFDAQCFVYDLFHFAEPKDGYCRLKDMISFRLWRYPGMEAELNEWVGRFLAWAESSDLIRYLEPRKAA